LNYGTNLPFHRETVEEHLGTIKSKPKKKRKTENAKGFNRILKYDFTFT